MKRKNKPVTIKGGSWYSPARWVRSAIRFRYEPVNRNDFTGFRIKLEDIEDEK
ncbi:MAG: hypothetical protein PVF17_12800 [Ignavibacteria bacterium]|jgi:formylglycine-generating enzyme required for sulfatase activity